MSAKKIIVATRQSKLAMTQTMQTIALLEKANPEFTFEISPFTSTGDRITDRPLSSMGGQGVFVKELEAALTSGDADIAIHSLKDVPSAQPEDLILAGFPKRENPNDIFLCSGGNNLSSLKTGAVIGTSSPRRLIQLKVMRPDFVFRDLRGNLDTRIRKLDEGQYDAIMVASAGMNRLGISYNPDQVLPESICIPAIGQGAIAIECRKGDLTALKIARSINDDKTEMEIFAERDFMRIIGAGCAAPVAAFAVSDFSTIKIIAMIGDLAAVKIVKSEITCGLSECKKAGDLLAEKILKQCKIENINIEESCQK